MTDQYKEQVNQQVLQISRKINDDVELVIDSLGLSYDRQFDKLFLPCPVHGGDNPQGCTIFLDGQPNWVCWTRGCHEEHKKNILGLIEAVLGDFNQAIMFCESLFNCNLANIKVELPKNTNDRHISKLIDIFNKKPEEKMGDLTREEVISRLDIPSKYYLDRNYSENTLKKFDVGDCWAENKAMSGRATVPVYDVNMNYIGVTGRSISGNSKAKWKHHGIKTSNYFYGMPQAIKSINETGDIILVEGPGDVWRMHEAGFENVLGLFGSSLSDSQLLVLESIFCTRLIIMTDNDDAGENAYRQIKKLCSRLFNIVRPDIGEYNDVGDMDIESIRKVMNEYSSNVVR